MAAIFLLIVWIISMVLAAYFGWHVSRDSVTDELMKNSKTRWKGLVYECDKIYPE